MKKNQTANLQVNDYRIMLTKIYMNFLKRKGAVFTRDLFKQIIVTMQNVVDFDFIKTEADRFVYKWKAIQAPALFSLQVPTRII